MVMKIPALILIVRPIRNTATRKVLLAEMTLLTKVVRKLTLQVAARGGEEDGSSSSDSSEVDDYSSFNCSSEDDDYSSSSG